jgi:Zn-dependent protease with chaperone function
MGHLKCDHGVWLTVANLLTLGVEIAPLVPTFVVDNFRDNLMRWVRAAELSCDRAALLVAGDPKVVVSVLMKLSGGCPKLSGQLNVDAFLDQARRYVYILIRVFMGN